MGEMSPSEVFAPLGVVLLVAFPAVYILRTIFKSFVKAGLYYSAFLILFFSYGHIFNAIDGLQIGGFEIGRHRYLTILFALLLFWFAVNLIKTTQAEYSINTALNLTSCVLVLIVVFQIIQFEVLQKRIHVEESFAVENPASLTFQMADESSPDIYYLIFDAYAREDVLKEEYGFNNRRFIDRLKSKGFYVAKNSLSNYAMTFLSIASSLNMTHLKQFSEEVGEDATGRKIPERMYQQSNVHRFLKERGYKLIQFASRWGPTNRNSYADVVYKKYVAFSSEFMSALVGTTWLQPLGLRVLEQDARKQILSTFEELKNIPDDPAPTFTFAHILIPHTPLFDKGESHSIKIISHA